MKTLKEYINDKNTNEYLWNILKEHLLFHIDVQMNIINPLAFLNESLGVFNNCGKVAEFIFNDLYNNDFRHNIHLNVKKYKTYFDYINIVCKESNMLFASYIGQENRIIDIELYIPKKLTYEHYDDLMFLIIHELMHGYEDKRRIKHGKPGIFNLLDETYKKSFTLFKSLNRIESYIGKCNYLLNDQEMNAYFGTLNNVIEKIILANNITLDNINYDKLINKIKNTQIFKIYFYICYFIITLNDDNISDIDKKTIVDIYNNYFGFNIISYNDIVNKLNRKMNKFYNKFNQLVPKIICKCIVKPTKKTYDIVQ